MQSSRLASYRPSYSLGRPRRFSPEFSRDALEPGLCTTLAERNVCNELQDVGAPSGAARVLGLGAAKLSVAGTLGRVTLASPSVPSCSSQRHASPTASRGDGLVPSRL